MNGSGQTIWYGEGRVITAEDWGTQSGALEHYLGIDGAVTAQPQTDSYGDAWFSYRTTDYAFHSVYVVNQGPVYTGPGFTTWPTYEGEASIVGYPYVRYGGYPAYRGYPYYRPGLLYHHGLEPRLGPRVLTLISARGMSRSNRLLYRDPRDR